VARAKTALTPTPTKTGQYPTADDEEALIRRFQAGDTAAEAEIVQRMQRDKPWAEAIAAGASTLRMEWITYVGGAGGFTHEVFTARARSMKRKLVGDDPTVLENLLAERIVICQIALEQADNEYMKAMRGESTFKKAFFYEHIMDRANRRYIHAIKALAQVRRLQVPIVAQLNVAANQVNVSAASDAPADPARTHVA
jgi:hypothetical protein